MSRKDDPGLGITAPPTHHTVADTERAHIEYIIPKKHVGLSFFAEGFTDEDLVLRMTEITPAQQDRAAKVAANNSSILSRELMFASLWKVGGWTCRDNRAKLNQWWDAIGRGRRLVEAAFLEMQTVEEGDVESFLASGRSSA